VTDSRQTRDLDPGLVYGRPAPQLLAALRALRTVPGPLESSQARALLAAAGRTGRTVVEVDGGRVLLGWDADAEGIWAGEAMEGVRSARPAAPRLLRALAGCIRCCWPDPDAPLYPARPAKIADVLAAVVTLGSIKDAGDPGFAGELHVRGALTTLGFAGLITLDQADGTLSLGPVIATWPERDVAVLRTAWSRLPARPPTRARGDHDVHREEL
jgi:hypothetical protein